MIRVKLSTRAGDLVTHVEIPVMNPPPEILIWGHRFFLRIEDAGALSYVEGIYWFVKSDK